MLRGTVGITLAMQAWLFVTSTNTDVPATMLAAALIACDLALTAGIFTSVCSTLVGLGYALVLLRPFGGALLPRTDGAAAVLGLAAAVGLALVGPGSFSLDARLFGRRKIFIPAKDSSESS